MPGPPTSPTTPTTSSTPNSRAPRTVLPTPATTRWGLLPQATQPEDQVWVGDGVFPGGSQYVSRDTLKANYLNYSSAAKQKIRDFVTSQRGFLPPEQDMANTTLELVDGLYYLQQSTGLKIGLMDYPSYVLRHNGRTAGANAAGAAGGGGGGGGGPTTTISKQTDVNLSNPDTARGLIDSALASELGRKPTDFEYANFSKALRAHEEMNPSTATQITTSSGPGSTVSQTSKSTRGGGVSAQQFAQEYAAGQEGAAEYKVATKYLDAFEKAIVGGAIA